MRLKVTSWNVNSVRARITHLQDFLQRVSPDIVLLQELKCEEAQFPKSIIEDLGYEVIIHGQKSFNGVAILSKFRIEEHSITFKEDPNPEQSRYIEAVINVNGNVIRVASVYVPNGESLTSQKYTYKLQFYESLLLHLQQIYSWNEKFIIGGDFNVAPDSIDVYDPKQFCDSVCFSLPERKALHKITNMGLLDSYRLLYPNEKGFTWWDYRAGAWKRNEGMRIDHILISPEIADNYSNFIIHKEERDKQTPSDHVPITAEFEL
ncbi:MAG: exodeoxyribonuclease III [Sphingobacteriia bacterium]|nr:exodeoxyribonuclease III [Sphingobacteriia bacterium]